MACTSEKPLESGVSWQLARQRGNLLQAIKYDLTFNIPAKSSLPLEGNVKISFNLTEQRDLQLDFNAEASQIKKVLVQGKSANYHFEAGHLLFHADQLNPGGNTIEIDFIAGDLALNRNEDFLYTLFVPDRASSAFPCFDQPDLKAKFSLTLHIPSDWIAIANEDPIHLQTSDDGKTVLYKFEETLPISTYLFSFATGKFQSVTEKRAERAMTLYHRETDTTKLQKNLKEIFDLHFEALSWLEAYTGMDYPFRKFGFLLIPDFQYGGMEHPGAILYRASSLLLEHPTIHQKLSRANLIAHETAHMWFGNLVTMKWFDDVWLKEVFANFLADKMVQPAFPEINHDLRFLMAHYPQAYAVDRTLGTHPVQQSLDNLKNAGTLYGAIIYHKAPIVMKQLELFIGKEAMRSSLQEYLVNYNFSNASWDDLIAVINNFTERDTQKWDKAWVKTAGWPRIFYQPKKHRDGSLRRWTLYQANKDNEKDWWPQHFQLHLKTRDTLMIYEVDMETKLAYSRNWDRPNSRLTYLLPNSDGRGYGYFQLDQVTIDYLLDNIMDFQDPVTRASVWLMLWENFLEEQIPPSRLVQSIIEVLPKESEPLIMDKLVNDLSIVFWKFLTSEERSQLAVKIEGVLLNLMINLEPEALKKVFFKGLTQIAISQQGVEVLLKLWQENIKIEGMTLGESDFTRLAYELAVREAMDPKIVLTEQMNRVNNPDRKRKMEFVSSALSLSSEERDGFFASLRDAENRSHEPWVLEALRYLHHPLRATSSVKYIPESLALLEELQQTGDIFFPKRWLDQTLSGHQSAEAANYVRQFLYGNPHYPQHLKNKILQSADLLFRAENMVGSERP